MVYVGFGDFIKSSSFRTTNTLDISNTDLAKAKTSQLKIVTVASQAKINPRKICQNLDVQIYLRKVICKLQLIKKIVCVCVCGCVCVCVWVCVCVCTG